MACAPGRASWRPSSCGPWASPRARVVAAPSAVCSGCRATIERELALAEPFVGDLGDASADRDPSRGGGCLPVADQGCDYARPGVLAWLEGCDLIVHAGDVGAAGVLEALAATGAVSGRTGRLLGWRAKDALETKR